MGGGGGQPRPRRGAARRRLAAQPVHSPHTLTPLTTTAPHSPPFCLNSPPPPPSPPLPARLPQPLTPPMWGGAHSPHPAPTLCTSPPALPPLPPLRVRIQSSCDYGIFRRLSKDNLVKNGPRPGVSPLSQGLCEWCPTPHPQAPPLTPRGSHTHTTTHKMRRGRRRNGGGGQGGGVGGWVKGYSKSGSGERWSMGGGGGQQSAAAG